MARSQKSTASIERPMPPDVMSQAHGMFMPAPAVRAWIAECLLSEVGALHNPDHGHLRDADFEVLWASNGYESRGRAVVGQAEEIAFRCNAWQRGRQEQQIEAWFGRVPRFLITLDARYAAECTDVQWCALVEHELYHIAQEIGPFGPVFTKEGQPKLRIAAHDVEEFVGVVRRYGTGGEKSAVSEMVKAAQMAPEVGRLQIAGACGTCLRRVA